MVAAALAGALATPAHGALPLVLRAKEAPGLKSRAATGDGARAVLQAALLPARVRIAKIGPIETAHFKGRSTDLWSLAVTLASPRAADAVLRKAVGSAGRAHLVHVRVAVGERGWLLRRRLGSSRPVVVLWRRNRGLGAIVLRAPRDDRRLSLAYARITDLHLGHALVKTAWQRTLDGIRPNGTVPRRVALGLFALAYGPLPGTKRPEGPRGEVEASLAADLIPFFWSTLARAQQDAAKRLLAVTDVVPARSRGPAAFPSSWWDPAEDSAPQDYGDPNFTPDPTLQMLAEQFIPRYQARLRFPLTVRIVVGSSSSAFDGIADSMLVDDSGANDLYGKVCRIRLHKTQLTGREEFEFALAHEVFHCFQRNIAQSAGTLQAYKFLLLPWVREGTAELAALSVYPLPWDFGLQRGLGTAWFNTYLRTCTETPLFQRSYDALGFFGHSYDSTAETWDRMVAIITAGDSHGSYLAAGGNNPYLLNSWASSVYLRSDYGYEWAAFHPVTPPTGASCPTIPVAGPAAVQAAPYTLWPYEFTPADFDPQKPLLHVQIAGDARLGDGAINTTDLADAWFCLRGKCECRPDEEGNPPPAPPLGSLVFLGLTGGSEGAKGVLATETLQRYCKKRNPKPPPPPPGPPLGGGGAGGGCVKGCGSSNGDPHLRTFDGHYYDFQGAGEFVLVRSRVDSLQIQAREEPFPGSKYVAINTALAMRVAGNRVVISRGMPLPAVRVNGLGFSPLRSSRTLPHGGKIRVVQGQIEVAWPDGSLARVWPVGGWGVAFLLRPSPARHGTLSGLLGNFDGRPANDLVTRPGKLLNPVRVGNFTASGYRLLYRTLGDSWRVSRRGSLFDYGRGQSTRAFTIRRFPARLVDARNLPVHDRRVSERSCRRLGIRNRRILQDCILDVGVTGDGKFATGARELERTAGRFGKPRAAAPRGGGGKAATSWTVVSKGGNSGIAVPDLAVVSGKVVAVYLTPKESASSVTFTPSAAVDARDVRETPIVSNWHQLVTNPVLIRPANGPLQVLLSGFHTLNGADPLTGLSVATRNADGSWGTPAPVTQEGRAGSPSAPSVLAPDGQPIWSGTAYGGLFLFRGLAPPTVADLGAGLARRGHYSPALGRDKGGRYWLAWYGAGSPKETGLYILRFDPNTLQPIGPPQRAPGSASAFNNVVRLTFPCAQTCRLVYNQADNRPVSWAYGEPKATVLAPKGNLATFAAAYTSGGRLWVAWFDANTNTFAATLGNAAGAGGKRVQLARPPGSRFARGYMSAVTVGNSLVLVENWNSAGGRFDRYVNVVAP